MIEEETKYEVIDISVTNSETLKGRQVTLRISFSSKFLEFLFEIHQVSMQYSDIILFVMADVYYPMEQHISFYKTNESIILYLPIMYDEIS